MKIEEGYFYIIKGCESKYKCKKNKNLFKIFNKIIWI